MIRILECSPHPQDATSYYRARAPLAALEKTYGDQVQITYLSNYFGATWADLIPYDVIFVQRPSTLRDLDFLSQCKLAGKKIWLDFDDLLHQLPESNPFYSFNKGKEEQFKATIELAHLVTVSTETLYHEIKSFNKNIHVVKNAHNDFIYPVAQVGKTSKTKKKIVWRGSVTHDADLFHYREVLKEITKAYEFTMFGQIGEYVRQDLNVPRENLIGGKGVTEYLNDFYLFGADVMIVPLEDNPFNKAKSNCSALEILYAGGLCLAPQGFSEFGGTSLFFNRENYKGLLENILGDSKLFDELHERHWNHVLENQCLSVVNKKRFELIKNL